MKVNKGYLYTLGAYISWGLFPIYWKLLAHVLALEVLLHRIIWSVPFIIMIFLLLGQRRQIWPSFSSKIRLGKLFFTALLISANLGIYIWAISNNKVIEASLGYFLTPIFNILFGFVLFKERLNKLHQISVVFASLGVFLHFISLGKLPWVSIMLGLSFSLYGAIRKKSTVDALPGLYMETILLLPIALTLLVVLIQHDQLAFLASDLATDVLLILGGVITTLPLVWYVAGARSLPMSTMGILFFITPSMQFLSGLLLYNEPLEQLQWLGFGVIWVGLAFFIYGQFGRKKC